MAFATDSTGAGETGSVRLITLDPGHFHAALFQKEMLPEIARRVHIYAPLGPDLLAYLNRKNGFNSRAENPTHWEMEVHAGPDFFSRLLAERPGNVVVVSGHSRGKIGRLRELVGAGLHVLADKPWIIEPEEFPALEETIERARAGRVLAYDAMTQRFEVSCMLQKELVNDPEVFGSCLAGSEREPAVYMESVHFLKKLVAGAPLQRPAWFFDHRQQGEPLADVGTHLVDLVQWTLSSERPLDPHKDLAVLAGSRTAIALTPEQFRGITGLAVFPRDLAGQVRPDGSLEYIARNSVSYTLRGVHVKLDVVWDYEAPPGGLDSELAIFRGSQARIEVRQGPEEKFVPEVFVVPNRAADRAAVEAALRRRLERLPPALAGLTVQRDGPRLRVAVPAVHRISHEAHFALLVRRFLAYREKPDLLPAWEDAFMRAKYRVTTEGVRLGRQAQAPGKATAAR